jgi:hypothetical protein
MAGHWATGAVHVVPVFGERGALLEHFVFDLFYNYPLTIRRRMRRRAGARRHRPVRYWHLPVCLAGGAACLAALDAAVLALRGFVPALGEVWYAAVWVPLLAGAAAALGGGGAQTGRRVLFALATGVALAAAYAGGNYALTHLAGAPRAAGEALSLLSWSVFVFAILAAVGGAVAETHAPAPREP